MKKKRVVKKKKKAWHKMTVTRVKLNPEQAVLTCCDAAGKILQGSSEQCVYWGQVSEQCGGATTRATQALAS
jgi:hypothetical protein